MSSIKLKHSSGNGVSITAPSSNPAADRTLELPSDADGVIAKTDSSGNLGIKTATPDSSLGIVGTGSDAATRISITDGSGKANVLGRYGNLSLQSDESNAVAGSLMQFKVDGSEKLRIQANGGISFNGDVAAANALNDYEEGTWTPSNPNGGYTFSNTAGYYTKVGNMVHWFLHAGISLVPNNNNDYEIHGLPYTSSNATHNYGWVGQVVYTANSNDSTVANMRALVNLNSTYIYFHTVGLGTGARVFNSTFRNGMQGQTIIIAGTYMAA